jgi:hypothetical protein
MDTLRQLVRDLLTAKHRLVAQDLRRRAAWAEEARATPTLAATGTAARRRRSQRGGRP